MRNVDTNHTTRKQQPWDLIAQDTNATKEVKHFTSTACAQKWSYLEMRYSRKLDRMGKTGRGSGVWLYFDQMRNLLEKELNSVKSCTSKLPVESPSIKLTKTCLRCPARRHQMSRHLPGGHVIGCCVCPVGCEFCVCWYTVLARQYN